MRKTQLDLIKECPLDAMKAFVRAHLGTICGVNTRWTLPEFDFRKPHALADVCLRVNGDDFHVSKAVRPYKDIL